MVMAGTERTPGPATDISLSARLQWLQQRREQLQEKLTLKNNELKNLCIDEAELTGVLPPEIPLEQGESPPVFRKRGSTCFAYPQNLINRLKTNEAEESTLELERQVQVGIAEASLGILNDPAESKTVRRKHRSIYQQSQRRLRELDARLSFIRQAYGRIQRQSNVTTIESSSHPTVDITQTNAKHRTKKPRPPLDALGYETGAKTLSSRNILQESGVSLSPSGLETQHQNHVYRQSAWSPRGYRTTIVDDEPMTLTSDVRNFNQPNVPTNSDSTVDRSRRRNIGKYPEHDLNDNHDVYILPDRYRPRTYSQGNNAAISVSGQKYCQDTERTYRTIPNTYTEEERQIRYRAMQQKRHFDSYNSRHNIPQDQHSSLHMKPPLHHNYQANYHPQQQQFLDNQTSLQSSYYQSDEFVNRPTGRYGNSPDDQRLLTRKNHAQTQPRGRQRETMPVNRLSKTNLQDGVKSDGQLAAGYWIRENDEIVWCPEESSTTTDRFGSLDRRKYNAQCAPYGAVLQSQPKDRGSQEDRELTRYASQQQHNSNVSSTGHRDYVLGLAGASKFPSSSAVTSHHPNYNSQVQHQVTTMNTATCYERVSPPPPRTLLRTQSLGSVETWQQQQQHQQNVVVTPTLQGHENQQTTNREGSDCSGRRKEKEWYETSMDSGYSGPGTIPAGYDFGHDPSHREIPLTQQITPSSPLRASTRSLKISTPPPPPPPPPSPPLPSLNSRDAVPSAGTSVEAQRIPQRLYSQQTSLQRHPSSPKSLEIPAESNPPERRRNVDDTMTTSTDRSPDLCTIVQAGKYQPYREVTKPFEMSDFYKYSTKYRKRTEAAATTSSTVLQPSNAPANGDDDDVLLSRRRHDSTNLRDDETTLSQVNPVQRRIYEPVQRMTCQPYGNLGRRAVIENTEEWRGTSNNRVSAEDSTVV